MLKPIVVIMVSCFVSAAFAEETKTTVNAGSPADRKAEVMETSPLGETVEKHLSTDERFQQWVQDEAFYGEKQGDRIEVKKVLEKDVKTLKLQNVVPPILFKSGEADIPEDYVERLREVLESVRHRNNVKLHFIGHTDNIQPMGAVKARYGDNLNLSRERAGTTAEYFQRALDLPPEAISYEGLGETEPVASNASAAGRAQNRRVEVEVWYDEIGDKLVDKEVVISEKLNRIKVCRMETVCKVRYKEGHSKRARVKNLVPPLHFDDATTTIPEDFLRQIQQALHNLRGKDNVVLKFIGYTDNSPLEGRVERIYGNHVGLSKARARRAALAVQDALRLPTASIDSDGKGSEQPIASNDTEKGRALNRRVEIEFWHDDPLQELPDEPQLCPEDAGAETVTRVYEPATGAPQPIFFESGKPVVTLADSDYLRRAMAEIGDKTNVRLQFIGYTDNQRLDRRTAMVYGDDIGLSTARARRAMEAVKEQLELTDAQAEFEGRGDVHADEVVNGGFVSADKSYVKVQVVYDELASLDERDGMEINRLTREVETKNPFALNLMRITVDGKPVDDPGKSIPDIQRCTDVALEKADIQFKFDNLELKPRLNVTAWPLSVRYQDDPATEYPDNLMLFRTYSNYPSFIAKSEVRIFESEQSVRATPLAVVEITKDGFAEWQADFPTYQAPGRELKYVLRVYDKDNNFDETEAQPIWIVDSLDQETGKDVQAENAQLENAQADSEQPTNVQAENGKPENQERELLTGYGENRLAAQNIPLKGGVIKVYGSRIPKNHTVWVAGRQIPIGESQDFVAEEILPAGMHTVEVAVLDQAGNGELFLRDLELQKSDWFYVGIADLTVAQDDTNGPAELVTNDKTHYDNDLSVDGRLAFYTNGKFGDGWKLTASADTREGPVDEIFSNFTEKSPDALFRRIDPDYYYPTYGDDSTVEETAPTLGKFYVKAGKNESYGMWGNFKIGYVGNSLAHVDRALYGANLHYQSQGATSFGENRFLFDAYAAEPGTVARREEFLGTDGSLYWLRHQDILIGSERVRVEIRDKDSGIVTAVKNLTPGLDYDIDYLQGRILLSAPLASIAGDDLLVRDAGISGNKTFLVVRYEFTPGFDDIDTLATGGRTHYWFGDTVKLGLTTSQNDEAGEESSLNAADVILRKSADTWIKFEVSESEGVGVSSLVSKDGGFNFDAIEQPIGEDVNAGAHRVETSIGFNDLFENGKGKLTLYEQQLEAGYSAPGLSTTRDVEQYGGYLQLPVTDSLALTVKGDQKVQDQGLETSASEVDVHYQINENWTLSTGLRNDSRRDNSPIVPLTQEEGDRSDAVVQAGYDSKGRWNAYGFVQDTIGTSGNRDENGRVGAGGSFRVTDRFKVSGEISDGDQDLGAQVATDYLYSDRTSLYLKYALENERTHNGVRARKGSQTAGFRTRYSDSASVYFEEKYTHGDVPTGLMHATGVDLAPTDRLNLGANLAVGTLKDDQTGAETKREALGLSLGYGFEAVKLASAFEYRIDEMENLDLTRSERTTWLTKNSLKYQITPDWRLIGKLNHSESDSSMGEFYDGDFTEAVLGYGYRPVENDRLNALVKYTYFYNLPAVDQVTIANTAAEYIQKSHIASVDLSYDVTPRWSLGGKYAYRLGQLSMDRENPEFFDNRAHLYVLRADWHFIHKWDAMIEGRMLDLPDVQDNRSGALVGLYRHLGDYVKLGAGYNFTDFSDDLTDLDYDSQGFFINLIGKI